MVIGIGRREFIAGLGGSVATWPLAARAQQPERLARIGYLSLGSSPLNAYDNAFLAGLRDLGYVEGKNLHIEYRFAEGDQDRLAGLLAELVDLKVDVIATYATGVYAAKRATTTIPIVMAVAADVVAMGVVDSLAHPGGNITGSTFFYPELMAKRLELLKTVAPSMTRVGVLLPRSPANAGVLDVMGATAKALQMGLQPTEVTGPAPSEFERVFSAWADAQIEGFVASDHALISLNTDVVAALAAQHRLPSIGPLELPASGGLMGYGVNYIEIFRRAAYFVDKILKGAKSGDIPIEQPTRFKLVLNLKTAKALGLTIPDKLLAIADDVIE
jgi:putative tryptophan/tyrosine transport system substrate-binding protein